MEHHRLPRHSSSHGTLHSSYSHGRSTHGPSPVRPLHKPLRSVNENSVLLPSPGALESMLKTTTETGDIGIFSIKPIPPLPQRREDIGLRSYSMTTCESRQLSHHKSTTTLQSQASGGPLQRPRSPFPYPTRLKRPGVRPASPALTETGRVDYSRMVEIDRASYRTPHGPYKPSYHPTPRRPTALGLRTDANLSTVSLPSQCLPPLSRYGPLGPSSIRTHSTASMASYNAPFRERFDSSSSRTSSLTSIVHVYHKPPHTPRVGPSGHSTAAPRYYDYTEGFESRQPRDTTPVQPYAPVPTRVSNYHHPLVLQDSDEHLAAVFRERDSPFFETGNPSPDRMGRFDIFGNAPRNQVGGYQATVERAPSRCRTGSLRSDCRSIAFDSADTERKFEKGSDIDLLPSQAGRDSMDTFNPSLDPESRDAPTYRYADYRLKATAKTKENSLERQVQVQGGRAPTIRSEQGVILRDDTQGETLNDYEIGESNIGSLSEERIQRSLLSPSTIKRPSSAPIRELSTSIQHETKDEAQAGFCTIARSRSDCNRVIIRNNRFRTEVVNSADSCEYDTLDNGEDSESKHCGSKEVDIVSPSSSQTTVVQRPRFRRHKRNQAVPRISTSSLPREDNEGFPYISPSCSTTPIVSPKPISPARQLKLKNSIPQLMKALPPLPGDPNYIPPPTPSTESTSSNDTDSIEVLAPFQFSRSPTIDQIEDIVGVSKCNPNDNRVVRLHKSAPKLRLKTKTSNRSEATTFSGTNLLNAPAWSPGMANPYFEAQNADHDVQTRTRNRLKLRSSRSTVASSTPSATVRRNVDGEVSNPIIGITRQRPRDLFTVSTSLSPTPSSINKKSPRPRWIEDCSSRGTSEIDTSNGVASQFRERTLVVNREGQNRPLYDSQSINTRAATNVRRPQRLRRPLSDHYLQVRSLGPISTTTDSTIGQDVKENKSTINFKGWTLDSREP
ncbi:uncharacterized protein F4812DRAFT_466210 [Daldinia caldariorum]|uniref:uncharacterized protein n=1 Tax=Daldinia caldariorum TaxID=326644 RepID=UPI0020074743|nr:uncharacterized protein F4812DRAFT_466210 [Daldinia caldariorum]KAI1465786.1 hypothetical protein F4812DRAFT_466210 [Daldinia caldariorum]